MRAQPPTPLPKLEDDLDLSTQPTSFPNQTPNTSVSGHRKKGNGVRAWLLLDSMGQTQVEEAGKHAIMRRTGLPPRDLRILDPLLSYPSTVLGRERAIVINLEHIKAIITAQEVLLLNSKDASVKPFVDELQSRILCHYQATKSPGLVQDVAVDDSNCIIRTSSKHWSATFSQPKNQYEEGDAEEKQDLENSDGSEILPFEFVALEACLEAACSCLENEATTLEQEAHPVLDKLTSKISTLNLERVRQIKSRLVALTGRVQKVRDELEHLLDDDDDMSEMYLTGKLLENSSTSSMNEGDDMDEEVLQTLTRGTKQKTAEISLATNYDGDLLDSDNLQDHLFCAPNSIGRASHGTRTSTTHSSIIKHLDVEELEMLLEAYFIQIDGTMNKLSTLREYVDDTEDYVNIMLDDKQNQLLQMGIMLTTATLVLTSFILVTGVFGMNIQIALFDSTVSGMPQFLWTVGGGTTGMIFLYVIAIAWYKYKRLL